MGLVNFFFGIFSFLILYQVITTFVGHLKSMPINFFRKLENTVLKSVQKPLMDREGTSSSKNDFDIASNGAVHK